MDKNTNQNIDIDFNTEYIVYDCNPGEYIAELHFEDVESAVDFLNQNTTLDEPTTV